MLGSSPIVRLRAHLTLRATFYLLAGTVALGAACTEGRLPTQPGGYVPVPTRVRLDATVANTGRAIKVVARYAKRADTLQVTPFDSTTLTLTGTETQLPVKLDIAPCLAAADRELPATLPADQSASVCVLRLVLTLLDANGAVIDQSVLPPIVARPGEESQAPPVSLGIPVGKVTVSPKVATINALTRTLDLATAVVDRNNTPITSPVLTFTSLDAAIATVDTTTGRVTARAVGTARIVVTSRDKADTATITVRQVPKTVTLTAPVTSLFVGDSVQVTAVSQDSAGVTIPATAAPVQFTSSDTSAATVTASGTVRTRRAATVTITGMNGPASGTLAVTVTLTPVATVTLTPNPDTVGIGMTSQLVATLRGANGVTLTGRAVTWASADTLKAKVDTSGVVLGVNVGTTTVTATSEGKSATATIVIEPALFCPSGAPRADSTLQASIARTPVNGTVYVCDGTFTIDSVKINKSLTLRSQHPAGATLVEGDPNVTAIQTGRPALSVVSPGPGLVRIVDLGFQMRGRGINLIGTYDRVAIDSSRFYGVDSTTSIPISVGVSSIPTAHVDITNSQFDHFGIGVFLISTTETFIRGNLFQNFNGGGVVFSSNGQAGTNYSVGRVEDNVFKSCGARNCIRGILIGPDVVIARNRMEIPGGSNGLPAIMAQRALEVPARHPMIIEDNVIVGAATGGDPQTPAGWTVQGGIFVNDSIGVENIVRRNTISGAHTGIIMQADGRSTDNVVSSGAYAFSLNGTLITAYFQRNDFTGLVNSFVSNSTRGSYQCNWWGSTSGPSPAPAGVPSSMYQPVASQPIANQPGVTCVPVAPAGARVWTGATSTDWFIATNWSPAQVPTASDSVVINAGGTQPVLTNNTTVRRLVLGGGATLGLNSGFQVRVDSGVTTAGTITGTGSLMVWGGSSRFAGTASNLQMRGQATAQLTGTLQITSGMQVQDTSSLTLAGHHLASPNLTIGNASIFTMDNAADTLDVGTLSNSSSVSTSGHFTAGVARVSGGISMATLVSTGTQFIANGTADQYWQVGTNATLADLLLLNTGGTMGVYLYGNGLTITGSVTQQSGRSNFGTNATIAGQVALNGGTMTISSAIGLTSGSFQSAAGTTVDGAGTLALANASGTSGILGSMTVGTVALVNPSRQAVAVNPALGYQNLTLAGGTQVTLPAALSAATTLLVRDSASLALAGHRLTTPAFATQNSATFDVTNAADTLDIATSLTLGSNVSTSGHLTAGVVRLAGGLNVNAGTLASTGTRFVATGSADQYWQVGNGATLSDLLLLNTGGSIGVYLYGNSLAVTGNVTQQSGRSNIATTTTVGGAVAVNGGTMTISNALDLAGGGAITTAAGTTLDGAGTLTLRNTAGTSGITGIFTVGNLSLSSASRQAVTLTPTLGYQNLVLAGGSQVTLAGTASAAVSLTVRDSSSFILNGRHFSTPTLATQNNGTVDVTNAADTLDIATSLTFGSNVSTSGHLTAGVVRLAGGMNVNAGTLASTGTRFVATGSADQYWQVGNSATLADLLLLNTGGSTGVYLYGNGLAITGNVTQQSGLSNFATTTTIGGAVGLNAGTMTISSSVDLAGGGQLQTAAGTTVQGTGALILRNAAGTSGILGAFTLSNLTLASPSRQAMSLSPGLGYQNLTMAGGSQVTLTGTTSAAQTLTIRDSANVLLSGHRLSAGSLTTADVATVDVTNAADTLDVATSLTFGSNVGTSGHLTTGTARLAGALNVSTATLTSTGTRFVANGAADQYWQVGNGATLADVLLLNTGGSTGVYLYGNGLTVTGNVTQQSGRSNFATTTNVSGAVALNGGTMTISNALDLAGAGPITTATGTTLDGGGTLTLRNASGTSGVLGSYAVTNLTLAMPFRTAIALRPNLSYGNVTVASGSQVSLTGTTSVAQTMVVRDSANVTLGGHRLSVSTMQTTDVGTFDLTNAADTLDVAANMQFGSTAGTSGHLTAGTLRVAGTLSTTTLNLTSTGTQLIANGAADQTWAIGTGSTVSSLVLANTGTGTSGVYIYSGSLAVSGNLTLQTGKFTNALSTNVAGTLTLAAGTKLDNQNVLKYGTFVNQGATITGNPPVQGP